MSYDFPKKPVSPKESDIPGYVWITNIDPKYRYDFDNEFWLNRKSKDILSIEEIKAEYSKRSGISEDKFLVLGTQIFQGGYAVYCQDVLRDPAEIIRLTLNIR